VREGDWRTGLISKAVSLQQFVKGHRFAYLAMNGKLFVNGCFIVNISVLNS